MFSSHTTFALVGCLTYNEYGSTIITKAGACASSALHEQHNHGLECCRLAVSVLHDPAGRCLLAVSEPAIEPPCA